MMRPVTLCILVCCLVLTIHNNMRAEATVPHAVKTFIKKLAKCCKMKGCPLTIGNCVIYPGPGCKCLNNENNPYNLH